MSGDVHRVCALCRARLSQYNPGDVCALCERSQRVGSAASAAHPLTAPHQGWLRTFGPGVSAQPLSIGPLLKECRATHGLSQAQLADQLGLDQSYVSKVENEQRELRDVATLQRIATRLSIPPRELGLAVDMPWAGGVSEDGPGDPERNDRANIRESQRHWRLVREELNRHRVAMSRSAAALYSDAQQVGDTPLLVGDNWLLDRPRDFGNVALRWVGSAVPVEVSGPSTRRHLRGRRHIPASDIRDTHARYASLIRPGYSRTA
jgi:transcriptional regulator with XRE-family HTH domain